ncbi:MAG: helix-turn-helix domain-containing protein [Deltaproteobacteria bacterium]|jgi:DNA-binding transcriptional regulator YdaS (Cro superfamily)|nr:helix-turn-helix domain-containing protein [Deltaproteobacteria bacterium]
MDRQEFKHFRTQLQKTQKQMAALLGVSRKAVCSYEQGSRSVPMHVERQVFFLVSRVALKNKGNKICWETTKCSNELRKKCPAWEFQVGDLCWFINGTFCKGKPQKNWRDKMKICRSCEVFKHLCHVE